MFLKRRNLIAWVLILLAAALWALGQAGLQEDSVSVTTPSTLTTDPVSDTSVILESSGSEMPPTTSRQNTGLLVSPTTVSYRNSSETQRNWSFLLCAAAVALSAAAIFALRQTAPLLGPDGAALALTLVFLIRNSYSSLPEFLALAFLSAVILPAVLRELWGWLRCRLDLDWCLSERLAKRPGLPQYALLIRAGWICGCAAAAVFTVCRYYYIVHPAVWLLLTASGCLGIACLWKYGKALHHFEKQLDNFRQGLPITVTDGAFAGTEAQLLEIQSRHEEAVRTAVTSERFKVELISNVSHDLRTPLTSILGYSELLQNETLSPDGQEQLRRLHQKAGYMNNLVESLFELTKVSSGVIEAKKEELDLIRLLEQTLGLFDDQLTQAGLVVRRHYARESVPILTDGARLHQVFANLLGNAIKYALAGTRIHLEIRETESSYLIRMMNTASYEMDFQPEEILQRFARGDKARSTKGSGLGLAIAQTYTESVGGSFRVSVDGDQFSAIVELPKS